MRSNDNKREDQHHTNSRCYPRQFNFLPHGASLPWLAQVVEGRSHERCKTFRDDLGWEWKAYAGVQLFWGDWRVELIGLNPVQRFVDLLKFMLGFQEPFRIGLLLHPVEQRPLPLKKLCDIGHVDLRSVAPREFLHFQIVPAALCSIKWPCASTRTLLVHGKDSTAPANCQGCTVRLTATCRRPEQRMERSQLPIRQVMAIKSHGD
jgi:hypothetical protein